MQTSHQTRPNLVRNVRYESGLGGLRPPVRNAENSNSAYRTVCLKRPQSGRTVVLWPPSPAAGVGGARALVDRADGHVSHFLEVRGAAGAGAVDRERRLGHETSRYGAARGASGGGPGLGWSLGFVLKWSEPNPPGFRPQQAPSPPGVISTPPVCSGGYPSASPVHSGLILGPCAMTGPRAIRGAEQTRDPRHFQTQQTLTRSCRRP